MKKIGIIAASTRPSRVGGKLAQWVVDQIPDGEWQAELVDLAALNLPLLDEEEVPQAGKYALAHTKQWAEQVEGYDAIIIVTPEYNSSFPAPIKNAIDMIYAEWNDKPVGLIGYGWHGGIGATSGLLPVLANVKAQERGVINLTFMQDVAPDGTGLKDDVKGRLEEMLTRLH